MECLLKDRNTNTRVFVCYQSPSHKNKRQQQELIAELKKKQVKDSRHVYEGKDGTIEDIITGNAHTHTHTVTGKTSLLVRAQTHTPYLLA